MAQSDTFDWQFIKCVGHFGQFFQIDWGWVDTISSHRIQIDRRPKLNIIYSLSACNDTASNTDKWLDRLEHSNWMSLVLNSLNAACVVAQCLDQEGSPVLVHGGKGLDSTLIVTSLVQIILNPDCRSVRGIQALIEREWIQAGFPFATRHKHSCYTPSQNRPKTSASTFVLFLDCVYQLHCQFPFSFEFGTQMLILLFEHSFFSSYGTFLGDSERERESIKLHTKTTSLWSYLNRPDVLKSLLNPMYEPNQGVIWPSVAPISLELWSGKLLIYHLWIETNFHVFSCLLQSFTWDGWSIKHKSKVCFIKSKRLSQKKKKPEARYVCCRWKTIAEWLVLPSFHWFLFSATDFGIEWLLLVWNLTLSAETLKNDQKPIEFK